MAALTGYNKIFAGQTTTIDTDKKHNFGARAFDSDGNEYIYLQGVTSAVAGSWVTMDEDHVTTLITASAVGRVAIAMAAIDATTDYGWFQIYGKNTLAIADDDITIDKPLFIGGESGTVDDSATSSEMIKGAMCRAAADVSAASPFTVEINYPFVDGVSDN